MGHNRPNDKYMTKHMYYYLIYINSARQARIIVRRNRTKVGDKSNPNPNKPKFVKMVACYDRKPHIEPKLRDPFTVVEGDNVLFKMEDPQWVAIIMRLMLTR